VFRILRYGDIMVDYRILQRLTPVTEEEKQILNGENRINSKLYTNDFGNTVNSALLLEKGKLITIRTHTRFIDFPGHTHDYIEAVYMCSGNTQHIINGKEVLLSEGELLFLSRHANHSIKKAGETDIAVNFIILPEFFKNSVSVLEDADTPLKKFITDCLCSSGGPDFLHFRVSNIIPIQNLIENLIWTLLYDTKNKRSVARATMELLFKQILSYIDLLEHTSQNDETVIAVLRYIEDNYRNGSLCEIAKSLHYDLSWLSREVKKRTGMTYTELVQKKRLSKATFYLSNTDMKISEICDAVGYDNISYFYKVFQKKYGVTPKKFRDDKRTNKDIF
jgi:AraC-like DNA-binding protein/mannose-6-phosphate isomerase-like protein (cupin superfamily)